MPQPYELTVSQAAREIKEKKLSPVDLAQSLLDRIEATDEDLQAWVTIDREEVLTNAKQREEEAKEGKSKGLLHGVPDENRSRIQGLRRFRSRFRRHIGGQDQRCWRHRPGQGCDHRIRHFRPLAHIQSVEFRTHARRLQQRLGGRNGCVHVRHVPGRRYRRVR